MARSNSAKKKVVRANNRDQKRVKQAETADRHQLYQLAVQDTEAELDFVEETYQNIRGKPLESIREDFCGTANTACDFVRRKRSHRAVGVDIDGAVLDWGREHNLSRLTPGQLERIELIQADVLKAQTEPVQAVLAMNFSYYLFRTRAELKAYFAAAKRALSSDGVLFIDAYGGYEAHMETKESRTIEGHPYGDFTYIWDQASFNPINHDMTCHIHFKLPDGSKMREAFSYHWRLWTLPELQEILHEAGFKNVVVYWEGTDEETGEGDGIFTPSRQGEADAGWVTYLTAWN